MDARWHCSSSQVDFISHGPSPSSHHRMQSLWCCLIHAAKKGMHHLSAALGTVSEQERGGMCGIGGRRGGWVTIRKERKVAMHCERVLSRRFATDVQVCFSGRVASRTVSKTPASFVACQYVKILPDRAHWPWYLCVPFIYVLFPLPHSKCLPVKFNPMGFALNNCALCEVNSMEPCVLWAECMIRCVYAHVDAPVKATLLAHVDLVWVENHKSSVESEYFYSHSWNVCPLFNW